MSLVLRKTCFKSKANNECIENAGIYVVFSPILVFNTKIALYVQFLYLKFQAEIVSVA